MKKIDSNSSHSPSEKRGATRAVVTNILTERKLKARDTATTLADSVLSIDQTDAYIALASAIEQLPELDTARVVDLHNRIISGEYEVDAERVADKLLALESHTQR